MAIKPMNERVHHKQLPRLGRQRIEDIQYAYVYRTLNDRTEGDRRMVEGIGC